MAGGVTRRAMALSFGFLMVVSTLVFGAASVDAQTAYTLQVSSSADRSASVPLDGETVGGIVYVFTDPDAGVKKVRFWLDDPTMGGAADQTEGKARYDFAGTQRTGDAKPFDTESIADGPHTITAAIEQTDGSTTVLNAAFTVSNSEQLEFTPSSVALAVPLDGSTSTDVTLDALDGATVDYTITDDAGWLTATPTSGQTADTINLAIDATGLAAGTHSATVTATDDAGVYVPAVLPVDISVAVDYTVMVSLNPDRSSAVPLEGEVLFGDVYIFTSPDDDVELVDFYLDDPTMSGAPYHSEGAGPFDLEGGAASAANPFDTRDLSDGAHTITAVLDTGTAGQIVVSGTFTVPASLQFSPNSTSFLVDAGATDSTTVTLDASDGGVADYTLSDDADWLTATPGTGQTSDQVTIDVDTSALEPGSYSATVTATDSGGGYLDGSLTVDLSINYSLVLSLSPDRSGAVPLTGQVVERDVYVYTVPEAGVSRVDFYIDDPTKVGSPVKVEFGGPFDLGGTNSDGTAAPFDSTQLSIGTHTVTAGIRLDDGRVRTVHGDIEVPPGLEFTPTDLTFDLSFVEPDSAVVNLDTNDTSVANFAASVDASWMTVTPTSGQTPASLTIDVDPAGLTDGTYYGTVSTTEAGYRTGLLPVQIDVGNPICAPLSCEDVEVPIPYELDFSLDRGGLLDANGIGTGFTFVDEQTNSTGYIPENIEVDLANDDLKITTTSGLAYTSSNSQDNALAVGIDAPSQITVVRTTLLDPPAGTGNFQQGGLWLGNDEDNQVKLVVVSTSTGTRIQYLLEVNGVSRTTIETAPLDLTGRWVELVLEADPNDLTIDASYGIDGAPPTLLGSVTAPSEFFSFDAAGIDPRIGTRTFTGPFASHRSGPAPLVYTFDEFTVSAGSTVDLGGGIEFDRTSFPVPFPTSMVVGPDGKLYVTEMLGDVHRITLDENNQVVLDEVIETVTNDFGGDRLALGIAIDPLSTPSNVIVWVNHSSGSIYQGEANSGVVSRLSGPNLENIENVITGIPRAIANHGPNSAKFGPDGRLYIAVGGSTGAGAPNDAETEFSTRPEQPLSAALLVADVYDPTFQGDCASWVDDVNGTADKVIPATCDVAPYATGLRNLYDFVFHSNGQIYGPDNGLGVTGTIPASATPDCSGLVPYSSAYDPGEQADPLVRIIEGQYYGHPNPSRDECVFKDGTFQGVPPLPNYEPPMAPMGNHKSANGTAEYVTTRQCSDLIGDLLIANYSVGDDITRVRLSEDGLTVDAMESLVGGFNDPLPLTVRADGTIFIGEFGAGQVTALTPTDVGCWTTHAPVPAEILDAGGAALNGLLYVVGGKTAAGPHSTVRVYDPVADSWSTAADLPGAAVENPAVVELNGKLYAFGGSTLPFSGAVTNAAVYDPGTDSWTSLAPMPTARGGATAKAAGGLIYVAGGLDVNADSTDVLEIYDPGSDSWSTGAPMATKRDNPGSAALDGKFYVFGGRTRAGGVELDPTLSSVEMYDPATNTWTDRAPMPNGRRTMVVGTLNGRAQVMGGEKTPLGGSFEQNEEYDPVTDTWRTLNRMTTPRHGAAAGTIGSTVYVVGGGPQGGGSFSNVNEAFSFEDS